VLYERLSSSGTTLDYTEYPAVPLQVGALCLVDPC